MKDKQPGEVLSMCEGYRPIRDANRLHKPLGLRLRYRGDYAEMGDQVFLRVERTPLCASRRDFDWLTLEWEKETGHHSNLSIVMRHQAARMLLSMGQSIIPWVLDLMKKALASEEGCSLRWSLFLRELTGCDPMPKPEKVGGGFFVGYDVKSCGAAWVQWGQERGFIT